MNFAHVLMFAMELDLLFNHLVKFSYALLGLSSYYDKMLYVYCQPLALVHDQAWQIIGSTGNNKFCLSCGVPRHNAGGVGTYVSYLIGLHALSTEGSNFFLAWHIEAKRCSKRKLSQTLAQNGTL